VKAAGPRARPGQDAPGHPLGRDQIGKLELDVHQLFTQVLDLPSELVAALPDPIEHPAHRSPLPPEIVISALSTERCCRCGGPIPARSREVHDRSWSGAQADGAAIPCAGKVPKPAPDAGRLGARR
jgi:hypothetical protein